MLGMVYTLAIPAEAGGLQVLGQPGICNEIQASIGYIERPWKKERKGGREVERKERRTGGTKGKRKRERNVTMHEMAHKSLAHCS
jgi:hypothetical protein